MNTLLKWSKFSCMHAAFIFYMYIILLVLHDLHFLFSTSLGIVLNLMIFMSCWYSVIRDRHKNCWFDWQFLINFTLALLRGLGWNSLASMLILMFLFMSFLLKIFVFWQNLIFKGWGEELNRVDICWLWNSAEFGNLS